MRKMELATADSRAQCSFHIFILFFIQFNIQIIFPGIDKRLCGGQ